MPRWDLVARLIHLHRAWLQRWWARCLYGGERVHCLRKSSPNHHAENHDQSEFLWWNEEQLPTVMVQKHNMAPRNCLKHNNECKLTVRWLWHVSVAWTSCLLIKSNEFDLISRQEVKCAFGKNNQRWSKPTNEEFCIMDCFEILFQSV